MQHPKGTGRGDPVLVRLAGWVIGHPKRGQFPKGRVLGQGNAGQIIATGTGQGQGYVTYASLMRHTSTTNMQRPPDW